MIQSNNEHFSNKIKEKFELKRKERINYLGKNQAEEIVRTRGNQISFRLATVFGYSFRMRTDLLVNNFTLKAIKIAFENIRILIFFMFKINLVSIFLN